MQDKQSAGRPTLTNRAVSPFSGGQKTSGYVNPTYTSSIFVADHGHQSATKPANGSSSHRRNYSSLALAETPAGVRSERVPATRTPHRYAVPPVSTEGGPRSQRAETNSVFLQQPAVETANPQLFKTEQAGLHEYLEQTENRKRQLEARTQAIKEESGQIKRIAALERSREKEAKAAYRATLDAQVSEYNRGRSKEYIDPSATGLPLGEREREHTPLAKKQRQQAMKSTLESQMVERYEQQRELESKHRQELAESDFLKYKQRLDQVREDISEKIKAKRVEEHVARSTTPPPSQALKAELEQRRLAEEQGRQQERQEDRQLLGMVVEFNARQTQQEAARRQKQKAELAAVLTRQIEERSSPAKEDAPGDGGVFVVTLPRPAPRPPTQTDMIGKGVHAPVLKPKVFQEKTTEATAKPVSAPKSKSPVPSKAKATVTKPSTTTQKKK